MAPMAYHIRGYISDNGIDASKMRIEADYKSFRLIGPIEDRELLLTAEFWPIDVRVKDYDKRRSQRFASQHNPRSNKNRLAKNGSGYNPPRFNNYTHYGY